MAGARPSEPVAFRYGLVLVCGRTVWPATRVPRAYQGGGARSRRHCGVQAAGGAGCHPSTCRIGPVCWRAHPCVGSGRPLCQPDGGFLDADARRCSRVSAGVARGGGGAPPGGAAGSNRIPDTHLAVHGGTVRSFASRLLPGAHTPRRRRSRIGRRRRRRCTRSRPNCPWSRVCGRAPSALRSKPSSRSSFGNGVRFLEQTCAKQRRCPGLANQHVSRAAVVRAHARVGVWRCVGRVCAGWRGTGPRWAQLVELPRTARLETMASPSTLTPLELHGWSELPSVVAARPLLAWQAVVDAAEEQALPAAAMRLVWAARTHTAFVRYGDRAVTLWTRGGSVRPLRVVGPPRGKGGGGGGGVFLGAGLTLATEVRAALCAR